MKVLFKVSSTIFIIFQKNGVIYILLKDTLDVLQHILPSPLSPVKVSLFHVFARPSDPQPQKQHPQPQQEEKWSEVKAYMNINDHLKGVDRGKHAPKVGLKIVQK